MNTRKVTNQLLDMVAEGILDPKVLATACLKYMSEDDVADMAHCNEFLGCLRGDGPDEDYDGDADDYPEYDDPLAYRDEF